MGSRAVCNGPPMTAALPTIPCTVPSLRATRPPRGACSGTPAMPLFTLGSTLESHLSQFYPTAPSFQVSATETPPPQQAFLVLLPTCRHTHLPPGPHPSYIRLYLSQQTTNPWRAGAMSYHTASRPRIGAREDL